MKTLIVGASGAIGRAVSLAFREDELIMHAFEGRHRLRHLIDSEGLKAEIVTCDLSDREAVERWVNEIPNVDRIVYVAGHALHGLVVDQAIDELDRLYEVHVRAMVRLIQSIVATKPYELPLDIVIVSSVWGEVGAAAEVFYSTVKAAQLGFVKAFAREAGPFHVRINAVTPGWIDTPMNDTVEESKQSVMDDIPLGRLGVTEDVAKTIRFLCSPDASYMTGNVVRIDGGWQ
ncbi:elongation factor P 5-aminopentanone reductase [Exiguobacterium qingdaonense]|uniref:elongation factor P 5-aminopentanone reductase n=1 Tax=Exiguobacterium qingdaonense TaxID=2751251 RepID=UPI001BE5E9F5|nr:SDR family oxidoreductase [Exiguobacterium qingdaonense]